VLQAITKQRIWLSLLLCMLLIVAVADRVPDPPIVKPGQAGPALLPPANLPSALPTRISHFRLILQANPRFGRLTSPVEEPFCSFCDLVDVEHDSGASPPVGYF
jgi:hypothetical protein